IRDRNVTGVQTCALPISNVGEDDIAVVADNEYVNKVKEFAKEDDAEVIVVSAKIEEEIAQLDQEEKEMFLEELGIEESGLDQLRSEERRVGKGWVARWKP